MPISRSLVDVVSPLSVFQCHVSSIAGVGNIRLEHLRRRRLTAETSLPGGDGHAGCLKQRLERDGCHGPDIKRACLSIVRPGSTHLVRDAMGHRD